MSALDTELFKKPEEDFIKHLQLPENDRIIFSGKFGIGKTTFLKHFFTDKGYTDIKNIRYEGFHLYPVNYSISSSEDILELIKYDIVLELLSKNDHIPIYQNDIDTTIPFIKDHYDKFIMLLLAAVPKVNKVLDHVELSEIFKHILEIRKTYLSHKKDINKSVNEANTLAEFLEQTEDSVGSLYESNLITQIIQRVLTRHKESFTKEQPEKQLENVLILDDLDRIDPEHIFRILNVFAAHFDSSLQSKGLKNKFGFDKVIVVCDINNIRKIFSTKYGQRVDFTGYIDKFFSAHIFFFLSGEHVRNFLINQLTLRTTITNHDSHQIQKVLGASHYKMLIDFLVVLYKNDSLSIRKILSLPSNIEAPRRMELYGVIHEFFPEKGLITLIIIVRLLGTYNDAKEALEHLRLVNVELKNNMYQFAHELFRIHTRDTHNFRGVNKDYITSHHKYQPVKIKRVEKFNEDIYEVVHMNNPATETGTVVFDDEDIYDYIFDALSYLKYLGLIT